MFEEKNQCFKNEIENQQVVIEMLITNDKCANGWKTVKTKFKNNTNIVLLYILVQYLQKIVRQ